MKHYNENQKGPMLIYFVDELETSFVLNDLINLSERFGVIHLFTINVIPNKSKVPSNVILHEQYMDWNRYSFINLLFKHFFLAMRVFVYELWKVKKWIPLRKNLSSLMLNVFKADSVYKRLQAAGLNDETIRNTPFYAFWFYDTCYLSILNEKYKVNKIIARAHGGDLYEDRPSRLKRPDLRHFQLKHLSALLPVSEHGTDYMKKMYPDWQKKIHTVYLGTRDGKRNQHKPQEFTLVSCARFSKPKRLDKIAAALLRTNVPLTWIHIGDERLNQNIPGMAEYLELRKQLERHPLIKVKPMGAVENAAIFKLYQQQPVSLFISLSENEGIPVSIMEAISFGIPVLATDAGGCREIVNKQTGQLLPVDISADSVAQILNNFSDSDMNTPAFREHVRKFWETHFSEEHNFARLITFFHKSPEKR